ncbi:MAG: penicillin acylase family protein [Fimbriimonadaceae bacterium]|nr:penicillin acylase family protein [Fimbriimonadaceae bacterium]QYK55313.1 MAG: penicillin acylase family protein [Fimbriimonadaceae bacterium]
MHALLLGMALLAPPRLAVERDAYGVAKVTAPTFEEACFAFGKVVAEDRLWQMETSRRVARGRMSEVFGKDSLNSDKDALSDAYTDDEYREMIAALPETARTAFREYARGVNAEIDARKAAGTLPKGYAENGFQPEPWTETDSAAISVMLARRFGTGGAGELRNFALWQYLKTQPVKDRAVDVLDDFLWFNDPRAIPTLGDFDDPKIAERPKYSPPGREVTARQLQDLPNVNLLELASSIRAANDTDQTLLAQSASAPYKTGSYAIVVAASRSANGRPILLSGPQMGLTVPSIVHEVALDAPGLRVAGIDVPGVPAIVVGNTPYMAWGLTTGVGDLADIFWAPLEGESYKFGAETRPLEKIRYSIKVKGQDPVDFVAERTHHGPVLLKSKGGKAVFSVETGHWKRELASWSSLFDMYRARSVAELDDARSRIAVNFNFFFATADGHIGWRYTGRFPKRAEGLDARFPVRDMPENQWQGTLPTSDLPAVDDPKTGLLVNWNNKPASWWPNGDTPAWGRLFRNQPLHKFLRRPVLTQGDLERAVWGVSHFDEGDASFMPYFKEAMARAGPTPSAEWQTLGAFDGWLDNGSPSAAVYEEAVRQLRGKLFRQSVGNFTSERFFEVAVQPSVMLQAMDRATKVDYLAGRDPVDVAKEAAEAAFQAMAARYGADPAGWVYTAASFPAPDGTRVAYSNRGAYIQITGFGEGPFARSVLPPGVAESGEHAADQVSLARSFLFKPVWLLRDPK